MNGAIIAFTDYNEGKTRGNPMAQLTVRRLDAELVRRLKIRAARKGHSAEAEHRAILEAALRPKKAAFWGSAQKLRQATEGTQQTDSAALIRADRDRDWQRGQTS